MKIHFWGVRGSIPTPATPARIKSKISAVIEQIKPEDIESAESRERFLAGLPPWLFGTVGGNSPCISLTFDNEACSNIDDSSGDSENQAALLYKVQLPAFPSDECIIFDCGSGIREMGIAAQTDNKKVSRYHIFMSHFHWDHLQGFPFFIPAYNRDVKLDFYSPVADLERIINEQMIHPYFPVQINAMGSKKNFIYMENDVNLHGRVISAKKMNHPGGSYAFCVKENDRRFIYATDTELTSKDFIKNDENTAFFDNADLIVIDSQYTLREAIDKYRWGHSAFSLAVDFAANWNIKHMVLFHHDPAHDDQKLYRILQSARWYLDRIDLKEIELTLAYEGLEINI